MKKNLLPVLVIIVPGIIIVSDVFSQSEETIRTKKLDPSEWRCTHVEQENKLRAKDPDFDKKRAEVEKVIHQGVDKFEQAKSGGSPQPFSQYIIPVVFHVVWNTAAQNVSDAKIMAQLDQLNKDWSRTSSDNGNTPAVWKPIAADMGIQFCLATRDPNGNPTTGIIRKQTSTPDFNSTGDPQSSSQGGDDPWDVNRYYNIWIANIGSGKLGYAFFPPIKSVSGAVMNYCTIGSLTMPGACAPFHLGRTLSHEMGHAFSLYHIWGDDGGSCTGSDAVSDTPEQGNESLHGCPSFPKTDACSPASPGVMFMNHMDYSTDVCYNMFTAGQKARCQSAVASFLMSIANNATTACGSAFALDAGVNSIVTPNGVVCNTTFTPVVKLQNHGANVLSSCTINYKIDNNPNQTYTWTGSLASGLITDVTLPAITTTGGSHTFTAGTSNPNSSADNNPGNDQSTSVFNAAATGTLPLMEGIENAIFPPANWTINNLDADVTWARTTKSKKTGTASMYMNNFNYQSNGQADELITSPYNMAGATSAQLTFQVAYQMYTNPASHPGSDTLKVYVSTDCGSTWKNVYTKSHTQLITATPPFSTSEFIPTASQWRLENISLSPQLPANSMLIKFRHTTDWENNLYVDDINITSVVGVNKIGIENNVSVFPNPSEGIVTVRINALDLGIVIVSVYDMMGKIISERLEDISSPKILSFNLSEQTNGVYFIEVRSGKGTSANKIILNK